MNWEELLRQRLDADNWQPTSKDVNDLRRVLQANEAKAYKALINNDFKLDKIENEYMRRYHLFLEQQLKIAKDPIITISILKELRHYYKDDEFGKAFEAQWKSYGDADHFKIKQAEDKLYKQFENMEIK